MQDANCGCGEQSQRNDQKKEKNRPAVHHEEFTPL
jgi:hypothetical protein